jgi:hypothetical protein
MHARVRGEGDKKKHGRSKVNDTMLHIMVVFRAWSARETGQAIRRGASKGTHDSRIKNGPAV